MADVNLYQVERLVAPEIRAPGYDGKVTYTVQHPTFGSCRVFAPDKGGAIWAAARHWGENPTHWEFHQECKAMRC